jgi:chemotaxis protein CheC
MLNETQADALRELLNIAFARTGAALSELTDQRVLLEVPEVAVYPLAVLSNHLAEFLTGELATVHQLFSGAVAGDAMLLMRVDDAARLTDILTNQETPSPHLDASGREVLIEVGNILLNACLGMFGNILQVHITFSVPHLQRESLDELFQSIVIDQKGITHALVTYTRFRLRDTAVNGSLVIVMGVTSLEYVIKAIDEWAARIVPAKKAPIQVLDTEAATVCDATLPCREGGTP